MSEELMKKDDQALETASKKDLGFSQSQDTEGLLVIPRVKMLQGSCEELKDPNLDCRVGDIINSLTKEKLPEYFLPILFSTHWIRFNAKLPNEPGWDTGYKPGEIIWRAKSKTDESYVDSETKFGPNGEKPLATQFLNFFSYFPGHEMPVILSFCKTSFKAGSELYSLCSAMPGAPYGYQYRLSKVSRQNPSGDEYFVLKVTMAGTAKPEDYDRANELAKQFAAKVDQMEAHDEAAAGTSDEDIPF